MAEFGEEAKNWVWNAAHTVPAVDVRVFDTPRGMAHAGVSGLDALLTTPQILAEFFRRRSFSRAEPAPEPDLQHEAYIRSLTHAELADLVWRQLFVDNAPTSEPARIVLTTLGMFGLNVASADLRLLREQYAALPDEEKADKPLALANLSLVLYPVESMEVDKENQAAVRNGTYRPVLALNTLLGDWKESARALRQKGYGLKTRVDDFTPLELRRHLTAEIDALSPVALSLDWPEGGHTAHDDCVGRLLREAVLPLCRERGLAFLLATGDASISGLSRLWEEFREVRFLLFPGEQEQFLSAVIAAYNNRNLLLCGPDQPLSYPRALEDYLDLRLETLGGMFHACHSGAAVAEELVGCWAHMRWTLGKTLIKHYSELWRTGWVYGEAAIRRDVEALLGGNVRTFLNLGT